MNITEWLPFSDVKGFVKLAAGVALILFVLKVTKLNKFVV